MTSSRGNKIANQFTVETEEGNYFQSYGSMIVFRPFSGKVQLDSTYWDYSVTTGRYRNQFLNEDKKATQAKIDSGAYELTNLN